MAKLSFNIVYMVTSKLFKVSAAVRSVYHVVSCPNECDDRITDRRLTLG